MGIFDSIGSGGFGAIFSIAGSVVSFMGQQEAAKAESDAANASAAISTFQNQQNEYKYTLAHRIMQRQMIQQQRVAQMSLAQSRAAQVNQGSGGQALRESSAGGGALGTIKGQEGTNIQGISNQWETYGQLFQSQEDIFGQQLRIAADKSQAASAQGTMALGQDISGLGGSLGKILPSFGNLFSNGGLFGSGNSAAATPEFGAGE